MISIPERFPQWSGYLTVTSTDEVASLVHNVLKDDVVFSLSIAANPGYAPLLTTGRALDTRPGKGIAVAVSPEGDQTKVVVHLQDGDTLAFESSHYLQTDAYRAETDGEDFCQFTFFYDHYDIKGFTFSARHQGRVFQGAVTCQSDDAKVINAYSMMAEEETEESKQQRRAHRDRNFTRRQAEEARQIRDLKLHLISVHCNGAALELTDEEAVEQHHDEHFGPGGIRHHSFESLHWDRDKVLQVLAEGYEMDAEENPAEKAKENLDRFIG